MKFVLASYGTRGDVEPSVAVGRELQRRGHDVRMAVPPDLVGFAESAGLAAVASGLDSKTALDMDLGSYFWKDFARKVWKIKDLIEFLREGREFGIRCRSEVRTSLASLADGADLLFTGLIFEAVAADVAEYHDIPLATLHYFPLRPNGQLLQFLQAPLGRSAMSA